MAAFFDFFSVSVLVLCSIIKKLPTNINLGIIYIILDRYVQPRCAKNLTRPIINCIQGDIYHEVPLKHYSKKSCNQTVPWSTEY